MNNTSLICPATIARRAYELYEERGRHHGFDTDDWLKAEAEMSTAGAQPLVLLAAYIRLDLQREPLEAQLRFLRLECKDLTAEMWDQQFNPSRLEELAQRRMHASVAIEGLQAEVSSIGHEQNEIRARLQGDSRT